MLYLEEIYRNPVMLAFVGILQQPKALTRKTEFVQANVMAFITGNTMEEFRTEFCLTLYLITADFLSLIGSFVQYVRRLLISIYLLRESTHTYAQRGNSSF